MDRLHTRVLASVKPMGAEGSVLTQVQLLSGPSTWLLLVSVLLTLSLVVSPYWVTSYMECRVVVPPSLCSAAAEVGSPAHGHTEHTGSSIPFSVPHFLGSLHSQFLRVIYCCFDTC